MKLVAFLALAVVMLTAAEHLPNILPVWIQGIIAATFLLSIPVTLALVVRRHWNG